MQLKVVLKKLNPELIIWMVAVPALYFMRPDGPSLCLLKWAGIPWCPGCGLGHGIHALLHGDWQGAIHHHWMAPAAVAILGYRIAQLLKQQYLAFKTSTKTSPI